jgi:hypothetical protein
MRTVKYFMTAGLALGLLASLGVFQAAYEDKPKHTIEEIMEKAHKGGKKSLYGQVVAGSADKEQKQELLNLYEDLGRNKPPKGSAEDWKKRTTDMVAAAKGVVSDKPGATAALKKAANCKGCHEMHKGE